MRMFEEDLENKMNDYLAHASNNELEIMASDHCSCLACCHHFSAREVHYWEESGRALSGRCPNCGLPYVVGDSSGLPLDDETINAISEGLMKDEKRHAFYDDICHFCIDFQSGKLGNNDHYAYIFEEYLHILHDKHHDPVATFTLANLYLNGSANTKPDLAKALHYFQDDALSNDGHAFYQSGLIYLARNKKGDDRKAFECFAKSSALGCLEGSMYVGLFYLHGTYVTKDEDFGLNALLSVIGGLYTRALTEQIGYAELAFCAFHIGLCFYDGIGTAENKGRAMHYWLISEYFLNIIVDQVSALPWAAQYQEIFKEALAYSKEGRQERPLYDEDTFYESFGEQQDAVSIKFLNYMEYAEDTGDLRFGFSSDTPIFIIDTGNACSEAIMATEWEMPAAKFIRYTDDKMFNRFEFVGQDTVRFILDDSVRGAVTVVELNFEPLPPEEPKE